MLLKKRNVPFFLFVLCVPLGACRSAVAPPGALVVALESMPQELDPRFATDANAARIGGLVFRSLTRLDEHLNPVPDLAQDWKLEDERSVVFRLRGDARFEDGSRLTADDVRATYESILDPATGSPKREELSFLAAVETPDLRTVRFRMREPYAPFLSATSIGILPRASLGGGASRAVAKRVLVGAGPFRVAAVEPGVEVILQALPEHRGLPEVRFRVIPDDTTRALELGRGSVQLAENAVEPESLRWLAANADLCIQRVAGTTFQYLGMNLTDPRLGDVRVRRAIAHAIDRPALIEHLLGGAAREATGLLPPEHWAYEGDVARTAHDPAAARSLLDAAGFPDPDGDGPEPRFRLAYETTALDSRRRLAEALQAMFAAVGIAVEVRSYEWGTFYEDVKRGNFQLYSLAWVGIAEPDFFYSLLRSDMVPPRGLNRGRYARAEVDRLTLLGRTTLDPLERQKIYAELQRLTAEDLPFIPMWWSDNVLVRSRRLCGVTPAPDGNLDSLRTAWWGREARPDPEAPGPCGCRGRG